MTKLEATPQLILPRNRCTQCYRIAQTNDRQMIVNLECIECGFVFDSELGKLHMDRMGTLIYENEPTCPRCGSIDEVYITAKGTQQLDKWFMEYLKDMK